MAQNDRATGAVYRDLLDWSMSLPVWQHELLRRLLRSTSLSDSEVRELADQAVAAFEHQAPIYSPLTLADLPAVANTDSSARLVAMRRLSNVNALREDQEVSFGKQLTVVYGDNASGKSGYARVLKTIYRARVVEDILPDVRAESARHGSPSAEFVVEIDGAAETVTWVKGHDSSKLGRFAVLDSHCSRTYILGGELAAGPAGIDVPQRFAEELDRIKTSVANRVAPPNKAALQRLENGTASGRFVKSLSATTTSDAIELSTQFGPAQEAQLSDLRIRLATARAQTPVQRRAKWETRLASLTDLARQISSWDAATSAEAVTRLRTALQELEASERLVREKAEFHDPDVPPGVVGGRAWSDLLNAALRFTSGVEGGEGLSVRGKCSLCWQPVSDATHQRLDRFRSFLKGEAESNRVRAAKLKDELLSNLGGVPTALQPQLRAAASDTEGAVADLERAHEAVIARRTRIIDWMKNEQ